MFKNAAMEGANSVADLKFSALSTGHFGHRLLLEAGVLSLIIQCGNRRSFLEFSLSA